MDRYDGLKLSRDFKEDAPTLLRIDLVRMDEAPKNLREQIREEVGSEVEEGQLDLYGPPG